jgi:hypothetical protein
VVADAIFKLNLLSVVSKLLRCIPWNIFISNLNTLLVQKAVIDQALTPAALSGQLDMREPDYAGACKPEWRS